MAISPHQNPNPTSASSSETAFEPDDLAGDEDLAASPWEGAVVYRRDASAGHVEYCTTLERLGLGRLSTGLYKSRASAMGIRVSVKTAKSSVSGDAETPVFVSVDVTRRKQVQAVAWNRHSPELLLSGSFDQSVVLVVGSRQWPLISRYRASVRTQSPKVEMIYSLYKPMPDGEDK